MPGLFPSSAVRIELGPWGRAGTRRRSYLLSCYPWLAVTPSSFVSVALVPGVARLPFAHLAGIGLVSFRGFVRGYPSSCLVELDYRSVFCSTIVPLFLELVSIELGPTELRRARSSVGSPVQVVHCDKFRLSSRACIASRARNPLGSF